jgi:hypothetical protein
MPDVAPKPLKPRTWDEIRTFSDVESITFEYPPMSGYSITITLRGLTATEKLRIMSTTYAKFGTEPEAIYLTKLAYALAKAKILSIVDEPLSDEKWENLNSDLKDYLTWKVCPDEMLCANPAYGEILKKLRVELPTTSGTTPE